MVSPKKQRQYHPLAPRDGSTDVYAIRCGDHIKIGVAENSRLRLRSLELTCPYPMELVARRRFPSREIAFQVEAAIHRELREQAHWGEWFRIEPFDPVEALLIAYDSVREKLRLPVVDTLTDEPPPAQFDIVRDMGWTGDPAENERAYLARQNATAGAATRA